MISRSPAIKLVMGTALALAGIGLARGNDTMAVLAAVVVWLAELAYRAQRDAKIHQLACEKLKAHNDALVAASMIQQIEYDRLVAQLKTKIGEANMVIRGTRR